MPGREPPRGAAAQPQSPTSSQCDFFPAVAKQHPPKRLSWTSRQPSSPRLDSFPKCQDAASCHTFLSNGQTTNKGSTWSSTEDLAGGLARWCQSLVDRAELSVPHGAKGGCPEFNVPSLLAAVPSFGSSCLPTSRRLTARLRKPVAFDCRPARLLKEAVDQKEDASCADWDGREGFCNAAQIPCSLYNEAFVWHCRLSSVASASAIGAWSVVSAAIARSQLVERLPQAAASAAFVLRGTGPEAAHLRANISGVLASALAPFVGAGGALAGGTPVVTAFCPIDFGFDGLLKPLKPLLAPEFPDPSFEALQTGLLVATFVQGSFGLVRICIGDVFGGSYTLLLATLGYNSRHPGPSSNWLKTYVLITFINGTMAAIDLVQNMLLQNYPSLLLSLPLSVNMAHLATILVPGVSYLGAYCGWQFIKMQKRQQIEQYMQLMQHALWNPPPPLPFPLPGMLPGMPGMMPIMEEGEEDDDGNQSMIKILPANAGKSPTACCQNPHCCPPPPAFSGERSQKDESQQ